MARLKKTEHDRLDRPVAFVADVHLASFREHGGQPDENGLNRRGRITIDTLERAIVQAVKLGCVTLIVGGDLFHHRRPEPAIITACQRLLARYEDQIHITIIPGNHDMLEQTALNGHTACQVVAFQAKVVRGWEDMIVGSVVAGGKEGDQIGAAVRCVPFESSKPMAEWLENVVSNFKAFGKVRALATHVGVVDDASPPWLRDARDAIGAERLFDLMDREDVQACLVGNYHQAQRWERNGRVIQQVGVLNPTGWGDPGLVHVGGLAVWDGVDVRWEQVAGPRFVQVRAPFPVPIPPDDCSVFVRAEPDVQVTRPEMYAAVERVEPDQTVVSAQEAAVAAPPGQGAEATLAEWVGQNVPEVDRASVLEQVRALWKEAS